MTDATNASTGPHGAFPDTRFDGLSALVSAPEVAPQIAGIVVGSTMKGLIAGVLIGGFARKVDSLPASILFGVTVGLILAGIVAAFPGENGEHCYWQILLPGALVGVIMGYATQHFGRPARTA